MLFHIKPSLVKQREKTVIKWTPVVIGKHFPSKIIPQKFRYTSGLTLNSGDMPKSVQTL